MFFAAFYTGTRPGFQGVYNDLVRWWDHGDYSHCELLFSDGVSGSSSWMDGGVRLKVIDYDPARWVFIRLPDHLEPAARAWFHAHDGDDYDLLGQLGFVWRPYEGDPTAWWCSEACAAALGIPQPWRHGPSGLACGVINWWALAAAPAQ